MFGLGFTEILLIAIIALLFIGPDKLPDTMKTIARTLGKVKRALDDTKATLEQELKVDDLRAEVLQYRQELEKAKSDLSSFKNIANKEAENIRNEVAKIEQSYSPTDINDSKLFDDLFDEAEKDFEELEKQKEEFKNKTSTLAKEAKEHLKKLESKNEEKESNRFKNIAQNKQNKQELQEEPKKTDFKHLDKKEG